MSPGEIGAATVTASVILIIFTHFIFDYLGLRDKRNKEKEKKYQEHRVRCLAQDIVMEHLKREHNVGKLEGQVTSSSGIAGGDISATFQAESKSACGGESKAGCSRGKGKAQ